MEPDWTDVFDVDDADDLFEHFTRDTYRGRKYRHLTDARHGVERGTAIVDGVVVRGFPSIPRTFVLDPGIRTFFDGPLAIEEKLNGYNVRVAAIPRRGVDAGAGGGGSHHGGDEFDGHADDHDGDAPWGADEDPADDLVAFTRSGYVCHYTTETVRDRLNPGPFFRDYPTYVVCGELVGPESPYTTHEYETVDSTAFRVFDVRHRETGDPLPVAERRRLCERYGFEQVRSFGTVAPDEAVDVVRDVIADLDGRGREGIVMKSRDGRRQLKYTTSAIHRADLKHAFSMPFDYGRDFVFSRIVREAFQAAEFDDSPAATRERARALGEAILLPAVEAIEDVDRGEPVGQDHAVRGDPATIDALLAQFRDLGLELHVREDREDGDERVVEFVKVSRATRDRIRHFLDGGTIDE